MRAPSRWNPRPRYSVLLVWAEALDEIRPAATMRAPRNEPYRFIAKSPPWSTCGPGGSRPGFCRRLFRNESSSAARPPQLEHEAQTSMEGETVEVHVLANDLSDARIEEFRLRSARVPERLSVQARAGTHVQVETSEELGAEAVVVVLEVTLRIGSPHREPLPADTASDIGLE